MTLKTVRSGGGCRGEPGCILLTQRHLRGLKTTLKITRVQHWLLCRTVVYWGEGQGLWCGLFSSLASGLLSVAHLEIADVRRRAVDLLCGRFVSVVENLRYLLPGCPGAARFQGSPLALIR